MKTVMALKVDGAVKVRSFELFRELTNISLFSAAQGLRVSRGK